MTTSGPAGDTDLLRTATLLRRDVLSTAPLAGPRSRLHRRLAAHAPLGTSVLDTPVLDTPVTAWPPERSTKG